MKPWRNSRRILIWSLLATLVAAASGFGAGKVPRTGEQVPNFTFTALDGKQHQLSEFDGHYVLLEFWATWCEPCVNEISVLKRARDLYQTRGLEILGLDSDRKLETLQEFVTKNQVPWLQSTPDSTSVVMKNDLRIGWYPTLILLDPQRKILLVSGNGRIPLKPSKLLEELDRLLPAGAP